VVALELLKRLPIGLHPQSATAVLITQARARGSTAMNQQLHHDLVVECDEMIDRAPDVVWQAVTSGGGATMPQGVVEESRTALTPEGRPIVQVIRPSSEVFMEQEVVDQQDEVMVLHMKMTRNRNLPWSAYESTLRVEPIAKDPGRSHIVLTCLATPTGEPSAVTGMLRGLMLLSLRSLKARVEQT
jgi:hypothetical protein